MVAGEAVAGALCDMAPGLADALPLRTAVPCKDDDGFCMPGVVGIALDPARGAFVVAARASPVMPRFAPMATAASERIM
jgi:hypothetical protein